MLKSSFFPLKRPLPLLVSTFLVLFFFGLAWFNASAQTFSDVSQNEWYFQAVEDGVKKGYIEPNQNFLPHQNVTRAELSKMLVKLGRLELEGAPNASAMFFKDVNPDQWFNPYIKILFAFNIARGYQSPQGQPTGFFHPDSPVTRNEAAVLLNRLLKIQAYPETISPFRDLDPSHWAYQDVLALHQAGMINGYENGSYGGNRYMTRAEIATLVHTAEPFLGQPVLSIPPLNTEHSSPAEIFPSLDISARPLNAITNETVSFAGPNGLTLTAQLYKPEGVGPFPAVVFMHGCTGLMTGGGTKNLGSQFVWWGENMAKEQTVALFVDSFSPRGIKNGNCSNEEVLNEVTERTQDAFAALAYLRELDYISDRHIGLMGWSNGGSTVLSAMAKNNNPTPLPLEGGFVTGIAEYPGCGLRSHFGADYKEQSEGNYLPYAPVLIFGAEKDHITPPEPKCTNLVQQAQRLGANQENQNFIHLTIYLGAKHSFDSVRPEDGDLADLAAQESSRKIINEHLKKMFKATP